MPPRRSRASASAPIDLTEDGDEHPSSKSRLDVPEPTMPRTPIKRNKAPTRSRKPPGNTNAVASTASYVQPGAHPEPLTPSARSAKRTPRSEKKSPEEKRLRRHRPSCPQAFHEVYQRATAQRFYVLERYRVGTPECPEEVVELTGSTGNIYQVHVARKPRCTCPHAEKGNQCKHMVYVGARTHDNLPRHC